MRKTRAQLIQIIRDYLDEPTAATSYYTDARLVRYLNQEIVTAGAEMPLVIGDFSISGAPDSNGEYAIPSTPGPDFHSIEAVRVGDVAYPAMAFPDSFYIGGITLLNRYRMRGDLGYWVRGGRIGFAPGLGGQTAKVYYRAIPAELASDGGVIELPLYGVDVVTYGVMARIAESEQDGDRASRYSQRRDAAVSKLKEQWARQQPQYDMVRIVE
jgi:hypothetical protein